MGNSITPPRQPTYRACNVCGDPKQPTTVKGTVYCSKCHYATSLRGRIVRIYTHRWFFSHGEAISPWQEDFFVTVGYQPLKGRGLK